MPPFSYHQGRSSKQSTGEKYIPTDEPMMTRKDHPIGIEACELPISIKLH